MLAKALIRLPNKTLKIVISCRKTRLLLPVFKNFPQKQALGPPLTFDLSLVPTPPFSEILDPPLLFVYFWPAYPAQAAGAAYTCIS